MAVNTANERAGDGGYVEVITTRAMRTGFAAAIGMRCWLVSARAVSSSRRPWPPATSASWAATALPRPSGPGSSSANLRVDGDVLVNKADWTSGTDRRQPLRRPQPVRRPVVPARSLVAAGRQLGHRAMCGQSFASQHERGATCSSAKTIRGRRRLGGSQIDRCSSTRIQLAPGCQYHPTPVRLAPDPGERVHRHAADRRPAQRPGQPRQHRQPAGSRRARAFRSPARTAAPPTPRCRPGPWRNPQRLTLTGVTTGGPLLHDLPGHLLRRVLGHR